MTTVRNHEFPIYVDYNGSIKIIIASDLHMGASRSCFELFGKNVLAPYADDPATYFLFLGDMINCIAPGDPRYRHSETHEMFKGVDNQFQAETFAYIDLVKKYNIPRSRQLGHIRGNHEETALKFHKYDPMSDICRELSSPLLGISAFLRLNIAMTGTTRLPYVIYCHHGMGGGSRRKGSGAQLEKYINYTFPMRGADLFAFAHEHAIADDIVVVKRPNWYHGGIARQEVHYINSGTYLLDEKYAERKMYGAKPVGHIEVTLTHQRSTVRRRRYHRLITTVHKKTWLPVEIEREGEAFYKPRAPVKSLISV